MALVIEDPMAGKVQYEDIIRPPQSISNISEWCKKEGCWTRLIEHADSIAETLPEEFRPVLLTSVLKNTQQAMVEIVGDVVGDAFTNEPYVGTLENGGVEIAPFHDLEPLVTPELQGEIEGLRQAVIAGELVVDSPSTP